MKVYRVKIGFGPGSCDDTWLEAGDSFRDVTVKAIKTAEKKMKDFRSKGRDIVSLEFVGEVEK